MVSSLLRFGLATCALVAASVSALPPGPPKPPAGPPHGPGSIDPAIGIQSTFQWHSTGALVFPKNDSRAYAGVKDPSIVQIKGVYHVFASVVNNTNGGSYNLVYFNFTDFNKANKATFNYLDQSAIGPEYRAAPEVFWFEPHKLWYLVYQNGNAAWSTNKNIGDPLGWSAPTNFYPNGTPAIVTANIGSGYWVDMWVICDKKNCFLFSSDDNGHFYRSQTRIQDFPYKMSEPVIALSDSNPYALYEASNVYTIGKNKYLLIMEAIGSDGNRYFRSWTSKSLAGTWKELAASEEHPFARSSNVVFDGQPWTQSISHGEVVRTQTDQTLSIRPCKLQYLYQGVDPAGTNVTYNLLPWRLGLLTQTNSAC